MKNTISIIAWKNRAIMTLFIGLILLGYTSKEKYLIYAAMLAIFLGIFQIISALILSPLIAKKDVVNLKKLTIYTNSVGIYIVICIIVFFVAELIPFNIDYLGYLLMLTPIILSLFFTYITEQIYQINKKDI